MKGYVRMLSLTIILVIVGLLAPGFIINSIPEVEIIRPKITELSNDIFVSGVIEEQIRQDITVDLPVVPQSVLVMVGDEVKRGDVIATIDIQATKSAIIDAATTAQLIPEEYAEVFNSMNLSLSMLDAAIPQNITAPISGRISSLSLVTGAAVLPKSVICSVSQDDTLRLKMSVSEEYADQIEIGDMVEYKAVATGEASYSAVIERIFPTASKVLSGTSFETVVEFYALPSGDKTGLRPGYTISGTVKRPTGGSAVVIPYEAVCQDENNIEFVYLYQKGRAVRRNIETGQELADGVTVKSGITTDDFVISTPLVIEKENTAVRSRGD